jgi:hypothetical protein
MNSNSKYFKYKNKYLQLKNNLLGGQGGTKTLYITIGVPGSGKTTRCERAAQILKGVRYEADDFSGLYDGGFKPELLPAAHAWCKENVKKAMTDNIEDIYQSNTNLNPRDMLNYLQFAVTYSYKVKIIIPEQDKLLHYPTELLYPDQKAHVIEVRSGVVDGQKSIPIGAMNSMITLFETNIGRIRKIKSELDENDLERNPQSWIDQINILFPRPLPKR